MEIKISIITINLNNKIGLEKTIQSVVNQNYSNIEYIVIDGDSNDGSKDLLRNHKIHKAISEKDSGIYNAMNKGLAFASGDYCLFLNSGDLIINSNIIEQIATFISVNNYSEDIIYGDLVFANKIRNYPSRIDLSYLLSDSLPHPASFFKREIFDSNKLGLYRENYKIVSDWIFYFDAYIKQYKFRHIDKVITVFDDAGISSSNPNLENIERNHALRNIYPNFTKDFMDLSTLIVYNSSKFHRYAEKLKLFFLKLKITKDLFKFQKKKE